MSIADLGLAFVEDLFERGIRKLAGKEKGEVPGLEAAINESASEAFDQLEDKIIASVNDLIAQFELGVAVRELADQVAEVPKAFEPKGTLPNILAGADAKEMPADWKPEESIDDWDNLKTPTPEGSSEK